MLILHKGYMISDTDKDVLEHTIADIDAWVQNAIEGKIAHCEEMFKKQWLPVLEKDTEVLAIPKTMPEFVALVKSRPYYKNKAQQMLEQKTKDQEKWTEF